MKADVRIAVVGAGAIAQMAHLPVLTKMRGVEVVDVQINGEIQSLVVNGVDVAAYVEAELDRREPERPKMRPTDPKGFREAWDVVERHWDGTVRRAQKFDPKQLHESVDGEWSFIETLRHLVFATDAWVRRGILGDPSPDTYDPNTFDCSTVSSGSGNFRLASGLAAPTLIV